MQTRTVTVPDWVFQSGHWLQHNWTTAVGVVVTAVLASICVELVKRKYKANNLEAEAVKVKKLVAWLLLVFSTLFSWLGYVIFFAQANLGFLQSLPTVGSHVIEALGVAYTLYNLRLNKYYTRFANLAAKWTKTTPSVTTVEPKQPDPSQGETAADFQ